VEVFKISVMYSDIIKVYFKELKVEVLMADYGTVNESWKNNNVAPSYSIFYLIEGGQGWFKINQQEFLPVKNNLVLLPAGVAHSVKTSASAPYQKFWCHFMASVGQINLFNLIQVPYCIQIDQTEPLRQLFNSLTDAMEMEGIVMPLKVQSIMYDILQMYFTLLLERDAIKHSDSKHIKRVNEILAYIDNHICENLTLEHLALKANYTPNYFIALFKSMIGYSPIQYINKKRIELAKKLLISDELSIAQIADKVGMDANYFLRVFKQKTNLTPTEFRNSSYQTKATKS